MFQTALKSIVAAALLLAVVGCQNQTKTQPASEAVTVLAQPVPIQACWQGAADPALASHQLLLVTSEDQLQALGAPSLKDAQVDFDQNDAVLVTMGQQPTGGYWICVDAIQKVGDVLYLQGRANAPGEEAVVTLAQTHPYCLVTIPKCADGDTLTLRSEFTSVAGQDQP